MPTQVSAIADICMVTKGAYSILFSPYNTIYIYAYRLKKQTVDKRISVLGGVTLKLFTPNVVSSINDCLHAEGLGELADGALPTVYRAEINGFVYHSRQYERVTKRNSFTISYKHNNTHHFALIECFISIS